jgi:hypothetical protein
MVDAYGHLIPGADVCYVDCLDQKPSKKAPYMLQQSATPRNQATTTERPYPRISLI